MSTKIEWTDQTWNPVTGCDRVSPGCDNCYAERMAKRLAGRAGYPADEPFRVTLQPDRLEQPLSWRKPRRVFVNSMSDMFHPDVPGDFIAQVFATMAVARQHTFQVLTKRPRRMAHILGSRWGTDGLGSFESLVEHYVGVYDVDREVVWPLPNVWLGTSVETQRYADLRIPHLLSTPAAVRFLSVEPLLGPVDISRWLREDGRIDWVIVGGESGPGARPMHPEWVRTIRDQCVVAGVPFFFKQWGEWVSYTHGPMDPDELTNGHVETTLTIEGEQIGPDDECEIKREPSLMLRLGKKAAGRVLDGRNWDEAPT